MVAAVPLEGAGGPLLTTAEPEFTTDTSDLGFDVATVNSVGNAASSKHRRASNSSTL